MAKKYSITVLNEPNLNGDVTFKCAEDESIMDAAYNSGIELNYSCYAGACSSCVMKRVSGKFETNQAFYGQSCVISGAFVPCASYPKSDMVLDAMDGSAEEEFSNSTCY